MSAPQDFYQNNASTFTSNGTTVAAGPQIPTGSFYLGRVIFTTASSSAPSIYDGQSTGGVLLFTGPTATAVGTEIEFRYRCKNGLFITLGGGQATVFWG